MSQNKYLINISERQYGKQTARPNIGIKSGAGEPPSYFPARFKSQLRHKFAFEGERGIRGECLEFSDGASTVY